MGVVRELKFQILNFKFEIYCFYNYFVLKSQESYEIQRFRRPPVWNAAIEFALGIFESTSKADFRGVGDLKNQIERTSVSISNNIAEGFERGTNNDLIHFLYISKGSAGECRSMLRICERSNKFKFQI